MSLDLTVLIEEKLSKRSIKDINEFLATAGVHKGEDVYESTDDRINVDILIDNNAEKDDYWEESEFRAIGFEPKAQICMASRQNSDSHKFIYLVALQIAKIVKGVIYDHQLDVVYDSDGNPYGHNSTDGQFEDYGSGIGLFMEAMDVVRNIINKE